MPDIKIHINGKEYGGKAGQTIIEIASANGIEIPSLCHDERVKAYGSCGICCVEAEGLPRLVRACSTVASNGMIIHTETERVKKSRKAALELLLSDHTGDCRPPCANACPAQTDCQGYVGLIANGEFSQSARLIKEKIPLPASIGRVCPHPCEDACRRQMVEEPIAIASLKQFAADIDLINPHIPEIAGPTGKNVAVIGGGPGGLSAAYYLRQKGHGVTVYEAMPKMGGMLRYGIPEYRLPKKVLDSEIKIISDMGIGFKNCVKIGTDITLDDIKSKFDAVVLAVGAWSSVKLNCEGEDLNGVYGGIDFLRDLEKSTPLAQGKKVAIVGGGNTAMDACRTAVRLGAAAVYNIYRRTKAEMPAEPIEIQEAEEEGVIFKNLTNPIKITGNGTAKQIELQIMELGEPDASGRRSPVPVPGKTEVIDIDTVIIAIGQSPALDGFEQIERTRRGTVAADETTFRTNIPNIFAIGDATNKGADIAIAAIGEAQKAAVIIDSFLNGEIIPFKPQILVERKTDPSEFSEREKIDRVKMPHQTPEQRRNNFNEVNFGLSEQEAVNEAKRCLECGCMDYFKCKLINYSNRYKAEPLRFDGEKHNRKTDGEHPYIQRNADKCVLCGLCARTCEETVGIGALGLVGRGFDTIVSPALNLPLDQTDCVSCGQCVAVCPTGALYAKSAAVKQVPLKEKLTDSVCPFCAFGCKVQIASSGNLVLRIMPVENGALLCENGRFGLNKRQDRECIKTPLIRENGKLTAAPLDKACSFTVKGLQDIALRFGSDSIAVCLSGELTNEHIKAIIEFAKNVLKTNNIFTCEDTKSVLTAGQATPTDYERMTNPETEVRKLSANVRGVTDALKGKKHEAKKIKALLVFGGENSVCLNNTYSDAEFVCFVSEVLTDAAKKADVILPLANLTETDGTVTNIFGKVQTVRKASDGAVDNFEVLNLLR